MECPVCYETLEGTKVTKLCCGHATHTRCLRDWYIRADSPSCPMCRGPVIFRGMFRTNWDEHKVESDEALLEEYVEQVLEESEHDSVVRRESLNLIMEAHMLYNTAKVLGCESDDIDCMLWEYDWISPKRATRNGKYRPDFVVQHKAPKHVRGNSIKNRWTKSRF